MNKKFLLVINGPMGGGKTTLAKKLHRCLPRTILIEPDYLKYTISDYKNTSKKYHKNLKDIVRSGCKYFLSNEFSVILDNSIEQNKYTAMLKDLAHKEDCDFWIAEIKADIDTCFLRVINRKVNHNINMVPPKKIKKRIAMFFKEKHMKPDIIINSKTEKLDDSVKKLLRCINIQKTKDSQNQ